MDLSNSFILNFCSSTKDQCMLDINQFRCSWCVCGMQFWEQPSSQWTWAGRLCPLWDVMPLERDSLYSHVSSRNGLIVSPSREFSSEEKAITACNGDDRSAAVWLGWGELYPVMDVESCIEVIYNSRRRFGEGCLATPCGIMYMMPRAKQVT